MNQGRVLIVDDEPNIRKTMEMIHRNAGWRTASVDGGERALARLQEENFDLIYLDLALPGREGIDVLQDIKLRYPDQIVVILTGQATIDKAVEALKLGAFDFLEKDCGKDKILITSQNALKICSLAEENRKLRSRVDRPQPFLGKSRDHQEILRLISRIAPTNSRVLILGESGTGKELIAREIHQRSRRASQSFIKVNCAAIPEELIEAELFGSVKGAYTGSVVSREGKFQAANEGTLFLDEVGDMSPRVQTKVLRALQEGEIEKVGSNQTITVDVRVIAATNKNLPGEVAAGRFREDLFFRLNVVPIAVRPLRDHPEDIPLLVEHFNKMYCAENDLPLKKFDRGVIEHLQAYPWPGNVRELKNQVERLAIMSSGRLIRINDLSAEIRRGGSPAGEDAPPPRETYGAGLSPGGRSGPEGNGESDSPLLPEEPGSMPESREGGKSRGERSDHYLFSLPLREAKRSLERTMIRQVLERTGWNVTRAAEELGLERTNLHKKIKNYRLKKDKR
ncbi:MAG: sigma-54-dependent Fis family transcriptional regulator [Candidatus Krumholzibacteriota bacterium]|nr:sigma-54-dependent Fis family transcriptional regulator [Candidatus Krumholzibacteriota bacterium]